MFWLVLKCLQIVPPLVKGREVEFSLPSLSEIGFWYTDCPLLTPLWYVRALFVLVLLSPIIYFAVKKFGVWTLMGLLVVYAVVCPYYPMLHWNGLRNFARVGLLPVLGMFYFSLGMALRMGCIQNVIKLNPLLSLGVGLALVIVRAFALASHPQIAPYCGMFAIPFVIYGLWCVVPSSKWPALFTANAFAVYLIHKFVLLGLSIVGVRFNASVILCLGMAVFVFLFSAAMATFIRNRVPRFAAIAFGGR